MTELKVISKKYNDKDILQVENFEESVKTLTDPEFAKKVNVVTTTGDIEETGIAKSVVESLHLGDFIKSTDFGEVGFVVQSIYDDEPLTIAYLTNANYLLIVRYTLSGTTYIPNEYSDTINLRDIKKVIVNPSNVGNSGLTGLQVGDNKYRNTLIYCHVVSDAQGGAEPTFTIRVFFNGNVPINSGEMLAGGFGAKNCYGWALQDMNTGFFIPVTKVSLDEQNETVTLETDTQGLSVTISWATTLHDDVTIL